MNRALPAALTLLLTMAASAAPPKVQWVFPPGGQIGQTVTVRTSEKLPPDASVWCDRAEVSIAISDSRDELTITSTPETDPGMCWLRFYNPQGATSQIPFVLGRLPELMETEPNDKPDSAHSIDGSSVVNAKLAKNGDVDVLAVSLNKGQTLVASVDANWKLGFPVDPVMQLLTINGTVLEQNDDDRGIDPLLAFTAPQDGTWLIRIFGFPAKPNSSIRFSGGADYVYRLTLTTGPYANHVMPLAVRNNAEQAEQKVRVAGWNLTDPLRDRVPVDLPKERESPGATDRFVHDDLPHPLPLDVVDEPVVVAKEPCHLNKPLDSQVPVTVCGVIDPPGDEDSLRFKAGKGEIFTIDVRSREFGYPLDATVSVLDAEGKVVRETDDASRNVFDPRLTFPVPADGEYTVRIRDLFQNGGWRFAYRMSIRPRTPSVELTLKSDVFKVTPGEPLEIPVSISRNDGFSEEVAVSVEGLPPGVTVEPVTSEPKGSSAKSVKLVVNADRKESHNGPIRIAGRYGDDHEETVPATVSLEPFNHSTSDIWLTVLPEAAENH